MSVANAIECPVPDCEGKLELSTKIYFDIGGELQDLPPLAEGDDGSPTVSITELEPSSLNDYMGVMPFNMEGELFIGCASCGRQLHKVAWGPGLLENIDRHADQSREEGTE